MITFTDYKVADISLAPWEFVLSNIRTYVRWLSNKMEHSDD